MACLGERWPVMARAGRVFEVENPHLETGLARVPRFDADDVDQAVVSARKAFDTGDWPPRAEKSFWPWRLRSVHRRRSWPGGRPARSASRFVTPSTRYSPPPTALSFTRARPTRCADTPSRCRRRDWTLPSGFPWEWSRSLFRGTFPCSSRPERVPRHWPQAMLCWSSRRAILRSPRFSWAVWVRRRVCRPAC